MRRFLCVLGSLLVVSPLFAARHRTAAPAPPTIRIGALVSLTGDWSTLGNASVAALELAARDINAEMEALRLPYRVDTWDEDTALVPANALAKLMTLDAASVHYVIGPQSSAEAAAVRDYANAHGMIVVSQGSTASSLAIAGDSLFRLAPNDKLEGAAIAALIRADGFDTLVPVWRNDAGNQGLHDSTKKSFEADGGAVAAGVSYDPATSDFMSVVSSLGSAARAIRNTSPNAKLAIYIASFDEAVDIFRLARNDADLASLRWYGGDGIVQSQAIVGDGAAADLAGRVQLTAPNVGLDESTKDVWQPVSDQIKSMVGFTPDAYALSVYDAAWVIALSFVESGGAEDLRRDAFVRAVQRYSGLTGSTALDANGDRKFGDFDFWTVRDRQWVRTAQYVGGHVAR